MTMISTASELVNIDDKIACLIYGWIAFDPDTHAYLYRSGGSRKAGRPKFYTLHINDFLWYRYAAYTVSEALEKAREILAQAQTNGLKE